ncbi:MAG: hypothetical protein ABR928_20035 [Terracidiphilus sp.]
MTITGIAAGVLVTLLVVWYEAERHWLTPGERSAAKASLVEIDLLQNAESMNGIEFDSAEKKAQFEFGVARDLVRTRRDEETVALLSLYLISTTSPWDNARSALEDPGASIDGDPKSVLKSWNSGVALRMQLHTLLHKELD